MTWETEGLLTNLTILTVCGSLGLGIGSIAGGSLAASLGGIRRTMLISNVVAIISCCLKLIEWFPALVAGRLLFGICCGAQQFCMSKALNDTVPVKKIQLFSQFINGGLGIGVFISNLLGFLIPILDEEDPQSRADLIADENWRIVYGFSIVCEVFALIIIPLAFPSLSLSSLVQSGEKEQAKTLVKRVYKLAHLGAEEEDKAAEEIVNILGSTTSGSSSDLTLGEALTSKQHRFTSWNAVIMTFINQFSGISAILFFQTNIFLHMKDTGEFTLLPVIWSVQCVNFINMVASFFSHIPSGIFGQRVNLITGTHAVYICLAGIVVFNMMDLSIGILICLLCHLTCYQLSLGAIVLAHVQETCADRAVGFATLLFFLWVVITSLLIAPMIDNMGSSFTFGFFAVWTFLGSIYLHFNLKDTTYKYVVVEEAGEKVQKRV
eukprot:CAMPEP_0170500762 /NCGR_PEP_ID=MMETSP0208-20121228/35997_1 /TAXON_ID=197538 /ORGANISM="Strombidium inclinatum, Strain S3" /LENGTH=435 /DNA_ID=CAMNT_0010778949 /DNA_START=186 /DNA_END=1490 /DNA_ORIENTATION=-